MKTIITKHNRAKLVQLVQDAPDGYVIDVREPTRSLQANATMWAVLADVSDQVVWHGRKLSAEDWKHIFSSSLKKQNVAPGLDGGFVVLGVSTSKMSIREMSDLIEIVLCFGAEQGVKFSAKEAA